MKRILALILSLILCFGFIVSCGKEEEQSSVPTSTPTSEAPSSSEPTQETPSSSEPPVSEAEPQYYNVVYGDVYSSYYEFYAGLENRLFSNYEEMLASINELGKSPNARCDNTETIDKSLFDDSYVYLVTMEYAPNFNALGFYDFKYENDRAYLSVDMQEINLDQDLFDVSHMFIYYVVIPKSELSGNEISNELVLYMNGELAEDFECE